MGPAAGSRRYTKSKRALTREPTARKDLTDPRPGLLTEKKLKNVDVIILGDMEKDYLREADYREIIRWLDGKNHSLLVLGGYNSFGPDGFRSTPLAETTHTS